MGKPNLTGKKFFKVANEKPDEKELEEITEEAVKSNSIYEIKLSLIDNPSFHDRTSYSDEAIQNLANNIKATGLIQPVALVKTNNGRYRRIAGFRRIEAMKLLGYKTIKAVLLELESESDMCFAMLSENIQRIDLDVYDEIRAITEVLSKTINLPFDETISLISRLSNFDSGAIKEITDIEINYKKMIEHKLQELGKYTFATYKKKLTVLNMHPLVISAIKNRKIDYSIARELHRLRKFEEKMLELLTTCINGHLTGSRELKNEIDEYLSTNQKEVKNKNVLLKYKGFIGKKTKVGYDIKIINKHLTAEQKKLFEQFLATFN